MAKVPQYQHILLLDKPKVSLKIIRYIIKCGMAIWYWHCYLSNIYIDIRKVWVALTLIILVYFHFLFFLCWLRYTVVYSFECTLNDSFKLISQQIRLKSFERLIIYYINTVVTFNAQNWTATSAAVQFIGEASKNTSTELRHKYF